MGVQDCLNFKKQILSLRYFSFNWRFPLRNSCVALSEMMMVKIQDLYDLLNGRFTLKLL